MSNSEIESPLDPGLPVIDSHHHLFDQASDFLVRVTNRHRFLIKEYTELAASHNVVATVAVEARAMYRAGGPQHLRVVGETEFLNGQAARGATGLYRGIRVAEGIVGKADLRLGAAVREVLEAHLEAAPKRFMGIRQEGMWDADPAVLGDMHDNPPHLYLQEDFRRGFAQLAPLGLSFDAFVLAPQLTDVLDLAQSFPDTTIVLDHLGQPVGVGVHAGKLDEEYSEWRTSVAKIACCPNVVVKMGGLGAFLTGSASFRAEPPATSEALAAEWRPYAEEVIELFGADRVMFESNLPTDGAGTFNSICNAYKRITAGCSHQERRQIFAGTAAAVYRLGGDGNSGANE
jgi:predicted TIM-barrel fold metal-dependent hydrolase